MNVYISLNGLATKGPCPDGFHIPTKDEWNSVKNIMTASGFTTLASYETYLFLPKNGELGYRNGTSIDRNSYMQYWLSDVGSIQNYAYCFTAYSTSTISTSQAPKAAGKGIRPFKDTPVAPDSTWTQLYGGTYAIYHNATIGLLSIKNGDNWITIADKNLGATTTYTSGDTLSESNCGKYYQRGNNYGFPFSGSITTSSSQVDASNYGPGNYYSSSTFITRSSSPYNWDSSNNDNLRGGEDGNVSAMELKNAYIGEVWTPGSNTLAYYPLTASSTVNDMSGNNRNLTKYGNCVFGTYQGVSCLYLPGSESSYLKYNGDSGSYYNFTMSFYYYCMDVGNWSNILYSNNNGAFVNPSNQPRFSGANNIPNTPSITNSWKHIVCVANGSVAKIYINGVAYSGDWQTSRSISTVVEVSGTGSGHSSKGYISNIIIESKARTDTEVLNYYNNTKSNYGL